MASNSVSVTADLSERQAHKLDHNPSRNQAQDVRLDQSNAPFHKDNAGCGLHCAGKSCANKGCGTGGQCEPGRNALGYIGEPSFASNEKRNQSLIGEPFVTGSSPAGGENVHARTHAHPAEYQVTAANMDARIPRAEGYIGEPTSANNEKRYQSLMGSTAFVTGADPAGGAPAPVRPVGDVEITSGSMKDNEDGTRPVALGGHYDRGVAKPVGEQDFDAVHGHKTDIDMWNSGQGSGFDKDWQYEDKK